MSREFYVRILKPVPDRFREKRIFERDELSDAGLEQTDYKSRSDKYHVKVKSRSIYTSMTDIEKYLKEQLPDKDFQCWGMRKAYENAFRFLYDISESGRDRRSCIYAGRTEYLFRKYLSSYMRSCCICASGKWNRIFGMGVEK